MPTKYEEIDGYLSQAERYINFITCGVNLLKWVTEDETDQEVTDPFTDEALAGRLICAIRDTNSLNATLLTALSRALIIKNQEEEN